MKSKDTPIFYYWIFIMFFISLDLISTAIALKSRNFYESNGFMALFFQFGLIGYIGAFILDSVLIYGILDLLDIYTPIESKHIFLSLFTFLLSFIEFITMIHNFNLLF